MQLPFVSRKRYEEIVYKLECLLCHVTGGRFSKAGYALPVMESWADQYIDDCIYKALAEAEAEHKWIPVEENLPTENDADDDYAVLAIHKASKKKYYHWRSVAENPLDFTHWMPLPDAP